MLNPAARKSPVGLAGRWHVAGKQHPPVLTIGALRRGSGIEQFLGVAEVGGVAAVRWIAVSPMSGQYRISLHTVRDLDDDRFGDLAEFPSLDPVDEEHVGEGRELGRCADAEEAIALAERLAGAAPDRWVNFAVAGEEYLDLVRARRRGSPAP
ncbi:hypothetical protein [Amycolatopsis sp. YIM 10]|uniref:hypothetical protein n=1 Tax=Amycolatopsis sp. YIM 10 TaxID=2653857 RepID=UPI0012906A7D|nr:hypothetical protein [Amycolatopsis sp. YIM 10]QFU91654.1 hypothetical protein YIM_32465 [Amycolatopsis sp. YIM 10]